MHFKSLNRDKKLVANYRGRKFFGVTALVAALVVSMAFPMHNSQAATHKHSYAWEITKYAGSTTKGEQVFCCEECWKNGKKVLGMGANSYAVIPAGGNGLTDTQAAYMNSTRIHYLSDSGSNENGQTHGGTPGDQTGNEWNLRDWSGDGTKWTHVLRHKNPRVGMKIAQLAIDAANNNKIGYTQDSGTYGRGSYFKELKKVGYQPSKITNNCCADCSSGVCANIKAAGYLLGITELQNHSASTTSNMVKFLTAVGFEDLTDQKYLVNGDYLMPGDILIRPGSHTATNITLGAKLR